MSNSDLLFLSKALTAKKKGKTAIDRDQFTLTPGQHRLRGTVKYDITADVGEDLWESVHIVERGSSTTGWTPERSSSLPFFMSQFCGGT